MKLNMAATGLVVIVFTTYRLHDEHFAVEAISPVKRSSNVLRDLFPFSGCQQGKERAREIHSTHGETTRRKEETA
jgi:hypothetical protein